MQIILDDDEIRIIKEALISEEREAYQEYLRDQRRGMNTEYQIKYLNRIEALQKRFKPYATEKEFKDQKKDT